MSELTLEQLKEELTKRGVEFHHLAGLPKLSELWSIHSSDPVISFNENVNNGKSKSEDNEDDDEETPPELPKTTEPKGAYEALRNVKHNGTYYKVGKNYDIEVKDAKQLLKLGYIK